MNRIKKKLRSQTGASLTFALLLFLVCAVVGSVVLVAGTAASGRLAGLADYEQRYYAVNSAAELLAKEIPSGEVRLEKTKKVTTTKSWKTTIETIDDEGEIVTNEVISDEKENTKNDYGRNTAVIPTTGTTSGFLKELAQKIVLNNETNAATIWGINNVGDCTFSFTINAGSTEDDIPEVNVDAIFTAKDRELVLTLYNNAGAERDRYKLRMTLNSVYKLGFPEPQLKDQSEVQKYSEAVEGDDASTKWTTVEEKTFYSVCTVKWKVSDVTIEEGA